MKTCSNEKLKISLDCKPINLHPCRLPLPEENKIMIDFYNILSKDIVKQIEDAFIQGLKLKGFEFKNKIELESFIKSHCTCLDNITFHERTYFVKNKPFFLYKFETEVNFKQINNERQTIFSFTHGSFAYL